MAGKHATSRVASSNTLLLVLLVLLVDDAGDAGVPFAAGMVLDGGGGPIQNSQCAVNGVGSSTVFAGNTLTLTLNINFEASFTENRILYAAGRERRRRKQHGLASRGDLERAIAEPVIPIRQALGAPR